MYKEVMLLSYLKDAVCFMHQLIFVIFIFQLHILATGSTTYLFLPFFLYFFVCPLFFFWLLFVFSFFFCFRSLCTL